MIPNDYALHHFRPLNALRRVALGTLLVASSSLAGAPFGIKLTGNASSKTISVVSTNGGSWDSLVVSHREPSALSEAMVGLTTTSSGLKVTGSALMTGVGTAQSLTVPEAGVYWVYAKKATAANATPDSVWAAGRVEFAPEEGRLSTWYDVSRKVLYIRVVVPSALSLGSRMEVGVTDTLGTAPSTSFGCLVSELPSKVKDPSVNAASAGAEASVNTAPTGAIVAWIHLQRTVAPDSVNVVFPATVAGAKPIRLHASRPLRDANLESAAHLLERIQNETNNPLVTPSSTTLTNANQLRFWNALVDSVPTWGGHVELLRALLTKKKGAATKWSDAVAALTTQTLSDSLKASMARPVVARKTQQNLTGPVYYGAYTRATLDNDLHFPLDEGEMLQILWQGSIDLYYMEPATTTGQPGILTKLALPPPPAGTTAPDPYLTTKQLLLAQGSTLLTKIQDSGLWVKGVRLKNAESMFGFGFFKKTIGFGEIGNLSLSQNSEDLLATIQKPLERKWNALYSYVRENGVVSLNNIIVDSLGFIPCVDGSGVFSSSGVSEMVASDGKQLIKKNSAASAAEFSAAFSRTCDLSVITINHLRAYDRDDKQNVTLIQNLEIARLPDDGEDAAEAISEKYPQLRMDIRESDLILEEKSVGVIVGEDAYEDAGVVGGGDPPATQELCPDFSKIRLRADYAAKFASVNSDVYSRGWGVPVGSGGVILAQRGGIKTRILRKVKKADGDAFYVISNAPLCFGSYDHQIIGAMIEPKSSKKSSISVISEVGRGTYLLTGNGERTPLAAMKTGDDFRTFVGEAVDGASYYSETSPRGNFMIPNKIPFSISCIDEGICRFEITVVFLSESGLGYSKNTIEVVSGYGYDKRLIGNSSWVRFRLGFDSYAGTPEVEFWKKAEEFYNVRKFEGRVNGADRWGGNPKVVAYQAAKWAQSKTALSAGKGNPVEGAEYGGLLWGMNGLFSFYQMPSGAGKVYTGLNQDAAPKLGYLLGTIHSHPNYEYKAGGVPCDNLSFSTPWTNQNSLGQGWKVADRSSWIYSAMNGDYAEHYRQRFVLPAAISRLDYLAQPELKTIPKSGRILIVDANQSGEATSCFLNEAVCNPLSKIASIRKQYAVYESNVDGSINEKNLISRLVCDEANKPSYP